MMLGAPRERGMATRARHHFICRFLLNRFASRSRKDTHWIWQLSPDREPCEISTRDAAVARWFYGESSTGVEESFGAFEATWAAALRAIDEGEPPQRHAPELSQLVWTLSIRTRAMREQFTQRMGDAIDIAGQLMRSDDTRSLLRRQARKEWNDLVDRELAKRFAPHQVEALRPVFQSPAVKELGLALLDQSLARSIRGGAVESLVKMIEEQNAVRRSATDGHIRGLTKLLRTGAAPEKMRDLRWNLAVVDRLVLGDACVVATSEDGRVGLPVRFGSEATTLYLPISPTQVLLAKRAPTAAMLTVDALNRASAELAKSHVYSSQLTEVERTLTPLIATAVPILSEEEFEASIAQAWRELTQDDGDT